VAEAARLGFRRLLVPRGTKQRVAGRGSGAELVEVANLVDAVASMRRAGLSSIR
jgi:predicted ATP-dependent serine protease